MIRAFVFLVSTMLLFVSCSVTSERGKSLQAWLKPNGKVKVLCTTAMIADVAKKVGGDRVDVLTLIVGELDPHSYELVKGDAEKFAHADIVFANGLGLEGGASVKAQLDTHKAAYRLGTDLPGVLYEDGHADPHIWMDAKLFSQIVPKMVAAYEAFDGAKGYSARGALTISSLHALHDELVTGMHRIPKDKRYLVTAHDAFHYFTRAYLADENEEWSVRCHAPEGLAPDTQMSIADIQEVVDHLLKYKIGVVFPESNLGTQSLRKICAICKESGLVVKLSREMLFGDAIGSPGTGAETYEGMLRENGRRIERALGE